MGGVCRVQVVGELKKCGQAFQTGIVSGRGLNSKLGGLTAKLLGGESLTWYTPGGDSPGAALNDAPRLNRWRGGARRPRGLISTTPTCICMSGTEVLSAMWS